MPSAAGTTIAPTFRVQGRRLSTARNDPSVVRDIVSIAHHRGWAAIEVPGQTAFWREAWMAGRLAGLDVRGYRPTERDEAYLRRRLERSDAGEALEGSTAIRVRAAGCAPWKPSFTRGSTTRVNRIG